MTVIILSVVIAAVPARMDAQVTTATLSGVVVDESGAVIPEVRITLVNVDTSLERAATANREGGFTFPLVLPGRYSMTAERDGFAPSQIRDIVLNVGDSVAVRVALKVGNVTDTVTVSATTTTSVNTSVSTLIRADQIADLPVSGRDFQQLLSLAPGMAVPNLQFNPAASGTRNTANNFVIDGITANEERTGVAGFGPGAHPGNSGLVVPDVISTEALQEFRVIMSNADASFGRGAGAQVTMVTKSGSNTLRGSAYEYFRNSRLEARDFFNRGPYFDDDGDPTPPPLRYHLFGATLGGPIARDRHFFFASYEGFRQKEDLIANLTLPNAALIGLMPGDLGRLFRISFLDSGFIPTTGNPTGEFRAFSAAERAAANAAGFPAALFDASPANGEAGVVISSVAQPRDYVQNAALVRTDHRLGNRVTLSARYARTRNVFERSSGRPWTLVNTTRDFDSGLGQAVAILSPAQTLEARGGWTWTDAPVCTLDLPAELTRLPSMVRGVGLSITGTTAFTTPGVGVPCGFLQTEFVPQTGLVHTWTRGGLTLRSGADVRWIDIDFGNMGVGSPTYQFNGLVGPNGLLGSGPTQSQAVAAVYTGTYFGGNGLPESPRRTYRSLQQEYFTQADWRVSPRLTLNLGVRYALFGVYDIGGTSNLYAVDATGTLVPDVSPFEFGRTANRIELTSESVPLYQPDRNNLQPRLGAAWDLTGQGRTILKGAYGIYHDRFFQGAFANLVTNAPLALSGSASAVPFVLEQLPALNPATPDVFAIDPAIRSPYFHRTSIGIDQRLARGTTAFAGYVGTFGRDLARIIDLNFGAGFPQASRPDPRFSLIRLLTNYSTSRYDALQVQVQSRPTSGVTATLAYTYSRLTDYTYPHTIFALTQVPAPINTGASAAAGFQVGPFLERPLDAEVGRADNDLPHVLAVSHVVDLPFGRGRRWAASLPNLLNAIVGDWSLAGVVQARSGAPVNLLLGRDVNDDGNTTDRPALLSGSLDDLYASAGEKTQYLVPQAEAVARLGAPGDVTDPFAQVPYNALRAPAVWRYDVSLRKQVPLGRARLAIELNAFNVFNRVNLGAPNASLSSALFGTITSTATGFGPRQLQMGGKLTF